MGGAAGTLAEDGGISLVAPMNVWRPELLSA
jgi:hypothetical protein